MHDQRVVDDIYSLTPLQQGMLFHGLYSPRSTMYWEQVCVTVGEDLNPAAFRESWRQVMARHAALRTHFHWEELDEPLQVVQHDVALPWEDLDWGSLDATRFDIRLSELLVADRGRGFQLDRPPLMRFYLIHRPDRRFTFLWSHHHILLDGWSGALVFSDVATTYKAAIAGETARSPRPRPFRDYVLWLQQQDGSAATAFWRGYLQGIDGATQFLIRATIPSATALQRYRQAVLALPSSFTGLLQNFARQQRLTLGTVMQGAWSLLLSHYSGRWDVVFGAVVSGRPAELRGAETMIGMLINTIPVRVRFDPDQRVSVWLQELQTALVERDRYAHAPLADILSASGMPPDVPLFESIFSFENYPVDATLEDDRSGFHIEYLEAFEQTNYPIAVVVAQGRDAFTLKITADADRFDQSTIQRMLRHYHALLAAIAHSPSVRLADIRMERPVAVAPAMPSDAGTSVLDLFETQAERTPDGTAVVCGEGTLSYRELNAQANRLARFLRDQGAGPDILIGICANRSLEMVVALLAVMKAGAAYVPLDPGYPVDRLRFILADAGLSLVLTDASVSVALRESLLAGASSSLRVVDLRLDKEQFGRHAEDNLIDIPAAAVNLAYVIYTSGSTGRPKGVMIEHRALLNHMTWMIGQFDFDASVRVLHKTPISFDASVWELFLPLMCGGELVLAAPDEHQDIDHLIRTIRDRHVTVLQGVPTLLEALAAHVDFPTCSSLTHIFSGGEVLTRSLAKCLRERLPAVVCNLYGPTEACIDTTFHVCLPDDILATIGSVPIGVPINNTFARVRDVWGHPVPVGLTGELCIGGLGLARQYLRRQELTAERFVLDPVDNKRLYRTGDLVEQRSDGTLLFLGRTDHQVKLHGYRIELGEIEAAVQQHPLVDRAVVVLCADETGDRNLTAYMTSPADPATIKASIRALLTPLLPHYMVPAAFIVLNEFPLTPSGKVDRRQLSNGRMSSSVPATFYTAPVSATERRLVAIWQEVLGREAIGIHDDFFLLGGHSLKAMQVLSRVRDAFRIKLTLAVLFDLPTVSQLSQRIETYRSAQDAAGPPAIEDGEETEEITI